VRVTRTESVFLRKILPSYFQYVSQQPDTLLPKFYGMHRVKRRKQKIYFLIQQNVFFSDVDDIHSQYDLKGSTQGRRSTKAERKRGAILKDLDWMDEGKVINIGPSRAKLFRDQLQRDTQWLRAEKIMDYSLLVGIHYLDRAKTATNTLSPNTPQQQRRRERAEKREPVRLVLDHSNDHQFGPSLDTVDEDAASKELTPFAQETEPKLAENEDAKIEEEPAGNTENGQHRTKQSEHRDALQIPALLMIRPSTTSMTGDDSVSSDGQTQSERVAAVRSHSADLQSGDHPHSECVASVRRSSEPLILSPNSKALDPPSDAIAAAKSRFLSIGSSQALSSGAVHGQSHSMQFESEQQQNSVPALCRGDSERARSGPSGKSSRSHPLSLRSSASLKGSSGRQHSVKHHVSVKRPERYQRKTAAEMQFAVDDVIIPKGIQHEAVPAERAEPAVGSPTMTMTATLSSPAVPIDAQIVMNTVRSDDDALGAETDAKDNRASILTPSSFHSLHSERNTHSGTEPRDNDREGTNSQDVCPWTTFHGGMVLEDDDGLCIGNEVYFVGLIDILQKYNKRKKLENWIKKIKYEETEISAAPPDLYAQRMRDFFDDKVV